MRYSWDDVAIFLAVLRHGTTVRAAAALGCSQPTVVRRIVAFEAALGLALFDRSTSGFAATSAALELREAAEALERAACVLDEAAALAGGGGAATVRLTLLDHFEPLFVPVLRCFEAEWPGVAVDLLASNRVYDLARGEADIAVRGGSYTPDDALLMRRLPCAAWTLYGAADFERPLPSTWEECRNHAMAAIEGPAQHLAVHRHAVAMMGERGALRRCSNYNAVRSVAGSGAAVAVLPVSIGDFAPELVRCFPPEERFSVPFFLIARRAALRHPPVRALFEEIDSYFRAHPEVLTGAGG